MPDSAAPTAQAKPQPLLSLFDAVTIMVGLVVGIGIFRTPATVAGSVDSETMFLLVWVLGGVITLIGALCYAELASAHPHAGGEYHFLARAYGRPVALLFGWARCTVIQTGSIAAVAFALGDYAHQLWPLGPHGPALYAAVSVIVFTAVNTIGTVQSKRLQVAVTCIELGAIVAIIVFGLLGTPADAPVPPPIVDPGTAALGMAMVFVLLTYGGWNEAAYLSGELKDPQRNVARMLIIGTAVLVALYLLTNYALLSILGLDGLRGSSVVATEMMQHVAGPAGGTVVALAIVVAAMSTLNATIFTGGRVFYAMACDLRIGRWMGIWDGRGKTPANALLAQGLWALALIALATRHLDGFSAMVNYTAPVFWGFMLLVALALFVLRWRYPQRALPYRVPLYPLVPALFVVFCTYMLHSGLQYAGQAGWIGLAVLVAGLPLLLFVRRGHAMDA
ncbi:amino acid permease [Lampropedia cohaerens]|uniref:Amino acid permease n=1 Tax=Lampropedia cohaerens TaxID=1610491 RepID=A0A0U1PWI3_9BURK|nr:amino acid permease [Lampropedia cohaerens]KKW66898.1 amino acid permease [Lampropedia cohaerens]